MPISLFLDWYEVDAGIFRDTGLSLEGWDVFESTDAVMMLAAVATLLLLVTAPPHVGRALMLVGAIAVGVVGVALADEPNFFGLPYVPGLSMEIGAWLGLLGALLILAAGALNSASAHAARTHASGDFADATKARTSAAGSE
jgi:hypothetical protein